MTVTLRLKPEVEARLHEQAKTKGLPFDEYVAKLLEDAAPAPAGEHGTDDPLLQLIGAFTSPVTDAAERHDYYIGQALYREMRGEEDND